MKFIPTDVDTICIDKCAFNALTPPELNMKKCTCCKKCVDTYPEEAIIIGREIELYIRPIDAENTRKLEKSRILKPADTPMTYCLLY